MSNADEISIGIANSAAGLELNPLGVAYNNSRRDTSLHDQMTLAFPVVKEKVDIQAWSNKVYYAVQYAVYKLGMKTRDKARAACPVDTGALKASIYVTSPSSHADQEAGRPYGSADAPGKASAGYRRAVEASARKMIIGGGPVLEKGEKISDGGSILTTGMHGQSTLRPMKQLLALGMRAGSTTRSYKGNLGRSLGTRSFTNYAGVKDVDHLPFTPMPFSTKEQFWVTVGAAAYYAAFVEFGTSGPHRQKAQPFMGPAVRDMERELQKTIADAIKSVDAKKLIKK